MQTNGEVVYQRHEDALKAIEEFHGRELNGRTIRVLILSTTAVFRSCCLFCACVHEAVLSQALLLAVQRPKPRAAVMLRCVAVAAQATFTRKQSLRCLPCCLCSRLRAVALPRASGACVLCFCGASCG